MHISSIVSITLINLTHSEGNNTLHTATVEDVHNYTNTRGNPAKYIEATLGGLRLQFIKNSCSVDMGVEIMGSDAIQSSKHRLYRGTVTQATKLIDIARTLLKSGDRSSIYQGHAIACALIGSDPVNL
jgi:hypothetical protein